MTERCSCSTASKWVTRCFWLEPRTRSGACTAHHICKCYQSVVSKDSTMGECFEAVASFLPCPWAVCCWHCDRLRCHGGGIPPTCTNKHHRGIYHRTQKLWSCVFRSPCLTCGWCMPSCGPCCRTRRPGRRWRCHRPSSQSTAHWGLQARQQSVTQRYLKRH